MPDMLPSEHKEAPAGLVARVKPRGGVAWVLDGLKRELLRHAPASIPIALKLALTIGVLIMAVMALLGALLVFNQSRIMGEQIAASGQSMVQQLAETAKEPTLADDGLALNILLGNLTAGGEVLGAAVLDETTRALATAGALPAGESGSGPLLAPLLSGELKEYDWIWQDPDGVPMDVVTYAAALRYEDLVAGYALVTLSRDLVNQSLHEMLRAVALATVVMVCLGFLMAFFVAKRVSRPIMDLVDAGRAIRDGHYQYRIRERRNDELGNLISAFNSMADGLLQKAQVEDAFSRYVSPSVARNVLANLGNVELGGRRVSGSVLFADIVGFTSISELLKPEQVADLLNEYFSYIARAASVYRGTVDKYIGDCAMLVFGVPEEDPDHAFNAVACATLIQAVVTRINRLRSQAGKLAVDFRYGLNMGSMLAGNMGSDERMQYTVVGDTVNLASRLCTYANPGRIVLSSEIYQGRNVKERLAAHGHRMIQLRGKHDAVAIYQVDKLAEPYAAEIERQADRIVNLRLWAVR